MRLGLLMKRLLLPQACGRKILSLKKFEALPLVAAKLKIEFAVEFDKTVRNGTGGRLTAIKFTSEI